MQYVIISDGMSLAVATRDRVDYSLNKSGVKLWACLFVFIVLTVSIYQLLGDVEPSDVSDGQLNIQHFFVISLFSYF